MKAVIWVSHHNPFPSQRDRFKGYSVQRMHPEGHWNDPKQVVDTIYRTRLDPQFVVLQTKKSWHDTIFFLIRRDHPSTRVLLPAPGKAYGEWAGYFWEMVYLENGKSVVYKRWDSVA